MAGDGKRLDSLSPAVDVASLLLLGEKTKGSGSGGGYRVPAADCTRIAIARAFG